MSFIDKIGESLGWKEVDINAINNPEKTEVEPKEEKTEVVDEHTESKADEVKKPEEVPGAEEAKQDETVSVKSEEKPTEEPKQVEEKVEEQKEVEKVKYKASDVFTKLDNTIKEKYGISYIEAQRIKSLDIEKLKDEAQDLLFLEGARLEDPETSERALEFKLKKYDVLFLSQAEKDEMIENGDLTESKLEELDIEFEEKIRKYSKLITNKQNELDLDVELDEFSAPVQKEENQFTEQQIEEVTKNVKSVVESYDKETIVIKDKDGNVVQEFDFTINDEAKTTLMEKMLSPNGLADYWKGDTQDEVLKKLSSAMFMLENKEKIYKSIYDQGRSAGELKTAKEISNVDFDEKEKSSKPQSDTYKSMREAYRQATGI